MAEHREKEDKMVVEYKTQYGDMLKLSMSMVKNYLVHGRKELVTDQELVFFMHTCKARKLNPFLRDCYLIKFSNEPAAIVTSRDYFTKNAWKNPSCRGWKSGIIVQDAKGEVHEREGCVLYPKEDLLGAWFRANPKDANEMYHSIPLGPYIKKKKDGSITKFWKEDNQPEMIAKVAEVQGLRKIWGEESTGMYSPEEMPSLETIDEGTIDIKPSITTVPDIPQQEPETDKDRIERKLNDIGLTKEETEEPPYRDLASRIKTPEEEPPPNGELPSLFEVLKGMRPSTSDTNMQTWKDMITEKADAIRGFPPDEYKYITKKWNKACPGEPFPARPLSDDGEPDPQLEADCKEFDEIMTSYLDSLKGDYPLSADNMGLAKSFDDFIREDAHTKSIDNVDTYRQLAVQEQKCAQIFDRFQKYVRTGEV